MVYCMQLTYKEVMDVLNIKHFPLERTNYTLPLGKYELSDINLMLKFLLPDELSVYVTFDDIRLRSNLNINQTLVFSKKCLFYTILRFTQSHSGPLNDIEGFNQVIAGSYKNEKPIITTGIDKVHLKCDCINGSIVNGCRKPILNSFAISSPPGLKVYEESRLRFFKK